MNRIWNVGTVLCALGKCLLLDKHSGENYISSRSLNIMGRMEGVSTSGWGDGKKKFGQPMKWTRPERVEVKNLRWLIFFVRNFRRVTKGEGQKDLRRFLKGGGAKNFVLWYFPNHWVKSHYINCQLQFETNMNNNLYCISITLHFSSSALVCSQLLSYVDTVASYEMKIMDNL